MNTDHPCTGPTPNVIDQDGILTCTSCGAFQRDNPGTGNVVWVRSGRVIFAPEDMMEAKQRHDERHGTNHASG